MEYQELQEELERYKNMYLALFHAQKKAIRDLQEAQKTAEEIYIQDFEQTEFST